jgi:hypothetical protein
MGKTIDQMIGKSESQFDAWPVRPLWDIDQREKGGLGISVKQEWAVSRGRK